jgi:4-amino-4-deoxy-L-arabinose transferase-like glycosyltransferase
MGLRAQPALGHLIVAAAVAGLVFRLAFAFLYWQDKPLTHDEREYLALAESVSLGRGLTYAADHETGTAQQFGRAPAYPVFLAALGAGAGGRGATPARVKVAQSIVGAVGVWLIGQLARRAAGPAAGVAAAAIAAVYPPLVWICAYVLSEALYSTAALATVLALNLAIDRADRSIKPSRSTPGSDPSARDEWWLRRGGALAILAGLGTGVAILVRPAMLLFLPLAAVWLLARRRTALAVALVVVTLLVLAPWTARNLRVYDRFVLVASEGGVTFWTGNHPLAIGEGDLAANPRIKAADLAFRAGHPGLSAEALEPLYYREALDYIRRHPGWWFGLLLKKAFYTVVPAGPSYALHSTLYRVWSVGSYLLLLPFAILGVRAWARQRRHPEALFVLAASAIIVGLVFFPQERFRIPVLDPTLIVCAAVWCAARFRMREN